MTGIICINKDSDITSFGVVAKVRGITREKKAGHTGTLDPMAKGVLPIMLGSATKLLNYIPDSDKGYTATFLLGKTTDTLDITGTVLTENTVNSSTNDVKNALEKFKGVIEQIPPMYSAVSIDGVRLYDLARQGKTVEREKRRVEIKSINLVSADDEKHIYTIDVFCSKGTYIRTLIDDLGACLGCGAVMTDLVRTSAMGFDLSRCVTLQKLQTLRDNEQGFESVLIPVDEILSSYEKISVSPAQSIRFKNGGALDSDRIKNPIKDGIYRIYSPDGDFLGLGKSDCEKGQMLPEKIISIR